MCGRYSLAAHPDDLRAEFGVSALPADYAPRYNIAPAQPVLTLLGGDGPARYAWLQWGFLPGAHAVRGGQRMINARAETVALKPAFRTAFRRQRCLVLADGFYEWQRAGEVKVPIRIRRRDGRPIAFAGIWTSREQDGEPLRTCAIITTAANAFMARIHDRMPAVLDAAARAIWLSENAKPTDAQRLLAPPADDLFEAYAVSPLVNSPRNDVPACIAPV